MLMRRKSEGELGEPGSFSGSGWRSVRISLKERYEPWEQVRVANAGVVVRTVLSPRDKPNHESHISEELGEKMREFLFVEEKF